MYGEFCAPGQRVSVGRFVDDVPAAIVSACRGRGSDDDDGGRREDHERDGRDELRVDAEPALETAITANRDIRVTNAQSLARTPRQFACDPAKISRDVLRRADQGDNCVLRGADKGNNCQWPGAASIR